MGHVPKTAKPSGKSMLGELPHRLCKLGQHCQSPSLNSAAGYGNERPIYILKTKPAGHSIAPPWFISGSVPGNSVLPPIRSKTCSGAW